MAGMLSGLSDLGLGNLEEMDIFEDPAAKKKEEQKAPEIQEKDLIYEKTFTCPVCDRNITAKVMKTGKAKLIKTDKDLRPKYEIIDAQKYDVIQCPHCGYAALTRFFPHLTAAQVRLIKEQISTKVHLHSFGGEICSYDEAMEHYKMALANAVVKRAKNSEKAYICLKTAWLIRGYAESVEGQGNAAPDVLQGLRAAEKQYLQNAYKGFSEALKSEGFPMCGMDETTINYLLAVLALQSGDFDNASKMVGKLLADTSVNARIKDKARDLKEEILTERQKAK